MFRNSNIGSNNFLADNNNLTSNRDPPSVYSTSISEGEGRGDITMSSASDSFYNYNQYNAIHRQQQQQQQHSHTNKRNDAIKNSEIARSGFFPRQRTQAQGQGQMNHDELGQDTDQNHARPGHVFTPSTASTTSSARQRRQASSNHWNADHHQITNKVSRVSSHFGSRLRHVHAMSDSGAVEMTSDAFAITKSQRTRNNSTEEKKKDEDDDVEQPLHKGSESYPDDETGPLPETINKGLRSFGGNCGATTTSSGNSSSVGSSRYRKQYMERRSEGANLSSTAALSIQGAHLAHQLGPNAASSSVGSSLSKPFSPERHAITPRRFRPEVLVTSELTHSTTAKHSLAMQTAEAGDCYKSAPLRPAHRQTDTTCHLQSELFRHDPTSLRQATKKTQKIDRLLGDQGRKDVEKEEPRAEIITPSPACVADIKSKLWDHNESLITHSTASPSRRNVLPRESSPSKQGGGLRGAVRSLSPRLQEQRAMRQNEREQAAAPAFGSRYFVAAQRGLYHNQKTSNVTTIHSTPDRSKITNTVRAPSEASAVASPQSCGARSQPIQRTGSHAGSSTLTGPSIAELLLRINAVNRDDPNLALQQIDAILKAEATQTARSSALKNNLTLNAALEKPIFSEMPFHHTQVVEEASGTLQDGKKHGPRTLDRDEGAETDSSDDGDSSVSSITNPTYLCSSVIINQHSSKLEDTSNGPQNINTARAQQVPKSGAQAHQDEQKQNGKEKSTKSLGETLTFHLQNYKPRVAPPTVTATTSSPQQESNVPQGQLMDGSLLPILPDSFKSSPSRVGSITRTPEPTRETDSSDKRIVQAQSHRHDNRKLSPRSNMNWNDDIAIPTSAYREERGFAPSDTDIAEAVNKFLSTAMSKNNDSDTGIFDDEGEPHLTIDASNSEEVGMKIRRWDEMTGPVPVVSGNRHLAKSQAVEGFPNTGKRRPHPWDSTIPVRMGRIETKETSMENAIGVETEFQPRYSAPAIAAKGRISDSSSNQSLRKKGSSRHLQQEDTGHDRRKPTRLSETTARSGDLSEIVNNLSSEAYHQKSRIAIAQQEYAMSLADDFDSAWVALPASSFFADKKLEAIPTDATPEIMESAKNRSGPFRVVDTLTTQEQDLVAPVDVDQLESETKVTMLVSNAPVDSLGGQHRVFNSRTDSVQSFAPIAGPHDTTQGISASRPSRITRSNSYDETFLERGNAIGQMTSNLDVFSGKESKRRGLRAFFRRTSNKEPPTTDPKSVYSGSKGASLMQSGVGTIHLDAEVAPPSRSRGRRGSRSLSPSRGRARSLEEKRIRNPNIAKKFSRLLRVYDD